MKNLLFILLISTSLLACSKDESEESEPGISGDPLKITLHSKNKTGNIFELMEFSLITNKTTSMLEIENTYDSLIWKVKELPGSISLLSQTTNSVHFTYAWSQNFFLPNTYHTILLNYKDGQIIESDTMQLHITNTRHFLGFDWQNITQMPAFSTGYTDVLSDEYYFATKESINNGVPSITLFLKDNKGRDENIFAPISKHILSDYITDLYSSPSYTENDPELIEKYNELFSNKKENATPVTIWIIPFNWLVLLKCEHTFDNYSYYTYEIHAEPSWE